MYTIYMPLSGIHATSENQIHQVSKVQKEGIKKTNNATIITKRPHLSEVTESFSEDNIFLSFKMCIYCSEILELT